MNGISVMLIMLLKRKIKGAIYLKKVQENFLNRTFSEIIGYWNSLDQWISKPFHARKIAYWLAKWLL